jgi:hypothetical protein
MTTRFFSVLLVVATIAACDKGSKKEPASTASGSGVSAASGSDTVAPKANEPPAVTVDAGPGLGQIVKREVVASAPVDAAAAVAVAAPDAGAAVAVVEPVVVDAGAVAVDPSVDAGAAVAVATELKAGDKIQAKWSDGYWYPAKITKVNDSGSYDIKYDDGTKVKGQPKSKVKPRKVKTGGKSTGGGCSGGRTKCGGRCVDLQNDPNNCWQCGRQCPEACMGGSCVSNDYKYGG